MDEERVEVVMPPRPAFTREQKFGYAVVVVCGVLAVVLGGFYVSKHIKAPFIISYSGTRFVTGEEAKAAEVARQKATDTDGDTVSDYDELKIYGSSPYLTDTDSDGLADDVEIASNGDPTCATGAACEDDVNEIDDTSSIEDGRIADIRDESAANAAVASSQLAQLKAMLGSLSAADVRTMLVNAGADQARIDAMTDDEVLVLYTDVITQLESSGELDTLLADAQAEAEAAAALEEDTQTETAYETEPTTP